MADHRGAMRCLQHAPDSLGPDSQVRDFRNDIILAEACHSDVETYCKDTPAGEPAAKHLLRVVMSFDASGVRWASVGSALQAVNVQSMCA